VTKKSTEWVEESSAEWATLERFARHGVQRLLQRVLEEEVDELLGRRRYDRRAVVDAAPGYRNGFGRQRRLSLSNGTITLRRPRVRGLEERFASRILPLFKRRTDEVGRLLPTLYLHGLALGDFDLALRGLLGNGAPLSPASIARLKAGWQAEYEVWKTRAVEELDVVYLWVDGVYVKAGLEKEKAAILVVLAGLRDGQKVILATWSLSRDFGLKSSGWPGSPAWSRSSGACCASPAPGCASVSTSRWSHSRSSRPAARSFRSWTSLI
jgi:putative transposase